MITAGMAMIAVLMKGCHISARFHADTKFSSVNACGVEK